MILDRLFRLRVPVWHHAAYRLPLASFGVGTGLEPRRADLALWALQAAGAVQRGDVYEPERIAYADLGRVHSAGWLESLLEPATLGRVFAVDPHEVVVDEVLRTVRLACGGTLAAARAALDQGGAALNLLGGFHHAGPSRGGGFCAVNDVAVAIAALRAERALGTIVVLDFDAHPPDGTADCLRDDGAAWIGSLSGADWTPLPNVDETVLPAGCGDIAYLAALDRLLERMPRPALAFVIAGGDVLAGDPLGRLGLTLDGARRRDLHVLRALDGAPSVWLPGGGYHADAWRLLAGTGLALTLRSRRSVARERPLRARYAAIARGLPDDALDGGPILTEADLLGALGAPAASHRLLGFYTPEGIELALQRYGILDHIRRLGYERFVVSIDAATAGDRVQLHGEHGGVRHVLIEAILEVLTVAGARMLFVNWLTLRNPRSADRPLLPGQDVPGLGLAEEMGELLGRMAARLKLAGVVYRPAWYHTAYAGRRDFRFVDPVRQGRFEALVRDLGELPLREATAAVSGSRVTLDGRPYVWEPDDMAFWLAGPPPEAEALVTAERERARFSVCGELRVDRL